MTILTPVEDLLVTMPNYVYGLGITYASTSTVTVAVGTARDSTNVRDLTLAAAKTVSTASVGINALDTGTVAVSTVYHLFIIGDSTNRHACECLLSLSATAPKLPTGYDCFRRIGCVVTVASTGYISPLYQVGTGLMRYYQYNLPISVLSGGTQTALTAVSLAAVVPAISNTLVKVRYAFTPNVGGNTATLASGTSGGITISGDVAAVASYGTTDVTSVLLVGVPNIYYLVAASGALSATVAGFWDSL